MATARTFREASSLDDMDRRATGDYLAMAKLALSLLPP